MNARLDNGKPWFAILLAAGAWSLQGLAGWLVSEFVCANADLSTGAFNATTLRLIQVSISVAALIAAVLALSMSVRGRRATSGSPRGQFVAMLALALTAAFTLGVVFAALGPLLLPLCERGR